MTNCPIGPTVECLDCGLGHRQFFAGVTFTMVEGQFPFRPRRTLEVWLHSVCGSRDGDCRYDYTIFVPMSTVFANDAAGDIWAKGLAGSLGVNAAAGNTTLAGISGPLRVTTGAGNVVAAGLRSATTDVEEGNGNVTLGFTAAPVDLTVRASTGNVSIVVPRSFSYRVSTSDQLGEVSSSIADDPSSPRVISLSVGTGNVFGNQFSG